MRWVQCIEIETWPVGQYNSSPKIDPPLSPENENEWSSRWRHVISLPNLQYDPPQGKPGGQIADILAEEVKRLSKDEAPSERCLCVCPLLLVREQGVSKAKDIKTLIASRINMWRVEKFDDLVEATTRCNQSATPLNSTSKQQESDLLGQERGRPKGISPSILWDGNGSAST
eukprot:GHVN01038184.1.p1 GENE.GHVN01038184.1~~GHVN01038184.1.p1  ORF type:complete len:172 (+),score=30.34 GHVN01038184.1:217-732(+)